MPFRTKIDCGLWKDRQHLDTTPTARVPLSHIFHICITYSHVIIFSVGFILFKCSLQVQLPPAWYFWVELPSRTFPRGGEEDFVQSIWHQVCGHCPGKGRYSVNKSCETGFLNKLDQENLILKTLLSTLLLVLVSSASSPCFVTSSSSIMFLTEKLWEICYNWILHKTSEIFR